jgi:hypothetical protein
MIGMTFYTANSEGSMLISGQLNLKTYLLVLEITRLYLLSFSAYHERTPIWASRSCDAFRIPPDQDSCSVNLETSIVDSQVKVRFPPSWIPFTHACTIEI